MLKLEIGKSYICKPIGVNYEVIGCVERTYTNTAVIFVESYDQRDRLIRGERRERKNMQKRKSSGKMGIILAVISAIPAILAVVRAVKSARER